VNPERWKRIEEIFHAAIDHKTSERAAFLAEACEGDESLRREVDGLLACHQEGRLFDHPPVDLAAALLAQEDASPSTISHYRIARKIGRGGMGEVYLAEDTRLNRKVALKLLPKEFTTDRDRIRRFEQEARAVSSLNHPNILTIYDIGQSDSSSFIASEYIEGETLRQRIRSSKMQLEEILRIVNQVAEALDAAHHAGIVHRDIKPENIMLRRDGYVKVLDFGLAKLMESKPASENSDLVTVSATQTGVVMGTARYMSPEQARGLKVDARTDIFSLGVVLYELLAGRPPFEGATSQDTLVAILEKHPPALSTFGGFPEELQWIITKALAKDVEERYQTVKDLLVDLKRVRKRLEIEEELKRSDRISQPVAGTKKASMLVSLVLLMLAALILLISQRDKKGTPALQKPFAKVKFTRLTSSGTAWGGAISPDGKYVAYLQASAGKEGLYLKQLTADSDIQILVLAEKIRFWGAPVFSHDGQYLYYETWQPSLSRITSLYRIPVLGGIPRKVIEDLEFFAISSDSKKIAFVRKVKQEIWLMTALIDGREQRKIRSRNITDDYGHLAWSPDGKIIAAFLYTYEPLVKQIVAIHISDGSERPLSEKWNWESQFAENENLGWVADGNGLVLAIQKEQGRQLYHLSYPNGELTSITKDLNSYGFVSVTRDSKHLVTTRYSNVSSAIYIAPSSNPDAVTQTTSGFDIEEGTQGLSWTLDGKIIYSSRGQAGPYNLWIMNPDGTNRKQITTGNTNKYLPVASPDGRYIVYTTDEDGIWRMDIDGSNPTLLPGTKSACGPRFSPDSKWILYSTRCKDYPGKDKDNLIKTSIDGKEKITLASHNLVFGGAISPIGDKIAYVFGDASKSSDYFLNIISSADGTVFKSFKLVKDVWPHLRIQWTPNGDGIAYIMRDKNHSNIRVQPLNGSPERRLTNLTSDSISNFSWSLDGKQIAYSRSKDWSYDIVLIENLR
jgi:serine/threonine protein kinase/Tol biopolymer transport system component